MTTQTTSSTQTREWDRHLTSRAERTVLGKALRRKAPRSSHAAWEPHSERPDPINLLEAANKTRLEHLVPIRYGRMARSPFAFYRGSADIMAHDLSKTPVSGISAQICGDAHLSNFGVYASPERRQVFDINDFDETLSGPWEWDVKRLAASIVLAGRQNGYSAQDSKQAVLRCIRRYREQMQQFSEMNHLDVWYFHIEVETLIEMARLKKEKQGLERASEQASRRTRMQIFPKLAEAVEGEYRIKDEPPLIFHYDQQDIEEENLDTDQGRGFILDYLASLPLERRILISRYRPLDLAHKVVGVGSVGTVCAIVLALGGAEGDDPLFMQIKEASASVLEPYLGTSPFSNHGERVVVGQRMMQATSDILLGWSTLGGRDFYVRQLRDMKFSAEIETMNLKAFSLYAELCAATLAHAHARTSDPAQISGYLGSADTFDQAIASFAETYANQAERDHAALVAAMKEGRVQAEVGI
jgi:uncharacterized protein (DUF2252 family)